MMHKRWLVLSTGFALFSMFFGSGNLVFPITAGQGSEGHYLWTSLGFLLTGVAVPFLGVWGMMLYEGDFNGFFSCFGKRGTLLFSFLALGLMGPFGVLARCLTVAHGALTLLFPNLSLPLVSFLLCAVIYVIALNKNRIVSLLGLVLTPFLLLSILTIGFFGLGEGQLPSSHSSGGWEALKNGFFQGYQTMDLLAAFFFAKFVIQYLKNRYSAQAEHRTLLNVFARSSLVGAAILSGVYTILVLLGSVYAPALANVPPQEMLGQIALQSLGSWAAPSVCLAVVFACLTTAIVLASLFAEFLRTEITHDRLGMAPSLLITLLIGFGVSTLEFAGIARFLGPILEVAYPALIVLTLVNVAHKFLGVRPSHWPVTLTLVAKLCLI